MDHSLFNMHASTHLAPACGVVCGRIAQAQEQSSTPLPTHLAAAALLCPDLPAGAHNPGHHPAALSERAGAPWGPSGPQPAGHQHRLDCSAASAASAATETLATAGVNNIDGPRCMGPTAVVIASKGESCCCSAHHRPMNCNSGLSYCTHVMGHPCCCLP
jgi:hypothetical protein